jgi:hypothetical protein
MTHKKDTQSAPDLKALMVQSPDQDFMKPLM